MQIKIAIVDDHPLLVKGLQSMLTHNPDFEIMGTYENGFDLLAGLEQTCPDVLLLDIQMSGQQGDELASVLHRLYPQMGIVVLTHMEHEYYVKSMLFKGVKSYILKSSKEQVLIEAIHVVAQGGEFYDPAIRSTVLLARQPVLHSPTLTHREKEIIELLALNYISSEIAAKLFISKRTVDRHRENLLLKMEVKNVASLIKKAIDLGLIK